MRLVIAALIVLIHAAPAAQDRSQAAPGPDGITRLVAALELALSSGNPDDVRALTRPGIPAAAMSRLASAMDGADADDRAILRERLRRPGAPATDVVVDVLVSRGGVGRLATWLLTVEPDDAAADARVRVVDVRELAAIHGLLRLRLDTTRQFAVSNLTLAGPDFTLRFASGTAFVAEASGGLTALVVRGPGEVVFTPPDPAELAQLRMFSRRSIFRSDVDVAFVRMNPQEFAALIPEGSLLPAAVQPRELERARLVFDEYYPRSFSVDLRALTTDQWSMQPAPGNLLFEFRTSRHGWLTYARSPNDAEDVSLLDRARNRNIVHYSSRDPRPAESRSYNDAAGAAYDIEHYTLDVAFDPARSWVSGRGAARLRVTADVASNLTMRLAAPLIVTSASSPEYGELLALRVSGVNSLMIGLPSGVLTGTRMTIEIAYAGRLPPQTIDQEGVAVEAAGQQSPQNPDDPKLLIVPEERFLYSSRAPWHPQGLTHDYATAEMRLTVPAGYQLAAVGRHMGSSVALSSEGPKPREMLTVRYLADRPVRYLSCLISRFGSVGRAVAEVPAVAGAAGGRDTSATSVGVEVFATARMASRNKATAGLAANIVRFFAETVGEAPYPHLSVVAVDDNLPGGHSPAYFVAIHQALPSTPYSWSDDPAAFGNAYPAFFLAHEIAHQWWGQAVGWRNYHEQWLSEGLAQYFAVLYAAADRGPQMVDLLIGAMRDSSREALAHGPIALGYRIGHVQNDGRLFRSIVYNKSAVVLHMLRRYVGDEAFFAGLRRYYAERRFSKAGTLHLRQAFEAASGLDLRPFFEQWIYGFQVPRVRLSSQMDPDGRTAIVRVEQPQTPFDFPLSVSLQFADGRTEIRDLRVSGALTEVRFPTNSPLRRATIRDGLSYYATVR